MANALFLYDNLLARYALSAYGNAWWSGAVPPTNLATAPLAQRWLTQSVAAADTRFQFFIPGDPAFVALVLAHHNFTTAAQVRLQGSADVAFSSTSYDSGWVNAFATGVTDASRDGQLQHFWLQLPAPTSAPYWRLQITDAANPAGYLAIGRMMLAASAFQPAVNMLAGAGLGYENRTEAQEADSGAEWFISRQPRKVARFTLGGLSMSEAMGHAFAMQRLSAGERREVMFVYDPADGVHSVRRQIFGRLRTLSALEEPYVNALQTPFEIAELLP